MVAKLEELNCECERVTYFYCYNPLLRKFLGQRGMRWNYKGFNKKSEKYYWTFEESEKLSKLIEEYKKK